MRIGLVGHEIILGILSGRRSHKDLKIAFDWEDTAEGHAYWSAARQADELPEDAFQKIAKAILWDSRYMRPEPPNDRNHRLVAACRRPE